MAVNQFFNFVAFKSAMEVADIDEAVYSAILRHVISYIKKVWGIDVYSSTTIEPKVASTTSSLVFDIRTDLLVGQMVSSGAEVSTITAVVSDELLETTTITVSPAFTLVPTSVDIDTTIVEFDLQYAIYLHAKYLFESQKKNTFILDSVTDSQGNRATYKLKPPALVSSIYLEYSPNAPALV